MKLLFDQNISFRIVKKVEHIFPYASQVRLQGLENYPDKEIWNFAKENNFTVVTFDTDFYDLSLIHGHPPKIVWLRLRKASTNDIILSLNKNFELIRIFIQNAEYRELGCLEIDD